MTALDRIGSAAHDEAARIVIELRWMLLLNDEYRAGLYGTSLRRHGPVPPAEAAVQAGYARRVDDGTENQRGYWITAAGRRHLVAHDEAAHAGEADK